MFTKLTGTLMDMAESPDTRFLYTVWFDYTRETINAIREGTMLAVPNFGSDDKTRRMSVLEITSVMPTHFALQGGSGGYPGFMVEAARSAAQDWETQENESTEETTKIEATAIPTNLEIVEHESQQYGVADPEIGPETNMAMVGSQVRALNSHTTNLVANYGIDRDNERNLTEIGTLAHNPEVEIIARVEDMLRTHFAIFGFTGVGKSNLLSTAVSKIIASSHDPVKIVFFDLMGEYTGLLIDQLLAPRINGNLLALGRNTLPEGVFKRINGLAGAPRDEDAAEQLVRYSLLPKALQAQRSSLGNALLRLIRNEKLRYFNEAQNVTVWDLFFDDNKVVQWTRDRQIGRSPHRRRQAVITEALKNANIKPDYKSNILNPEKARRIREELETLLENNEFKDDFPAHINKLREIEYSTAYVFEASTTLPEIIADLNDDEQSSLWIIQAHDPNDLREFSNQLGMELYEIRRLSGRIDPLVCFIFDEADEFIRRDGSGSYKASAEIAETIARRGRKFGIGLGIATQRIRYLDTNIMAQPHTYFISKLPRASDREAVAEAFGFGNEMLKQTFKFTKGQWLLVSHDATGLEGVPLPVKTEDANVRVETFLKNLPTAPS